MIKPYIVEENVFVVVYKLLAQKKILKCLVKDCFKISGKQMINQLQPMHTKWSNTLKQFVACYQQIV